jgi:uncharacterized membrane protein YdjX (TVP38/TMEM64 family)
MKEQISGEKADRQTRKRFWSKQRFLQIAAVLFALFVSVSIVVLRDNISRLGGYSYLGAFLIPLLCCATIIVPVPGLIIIFTLGAVLNPLFVGIISGVGGTLGETTGYLLGYGGRSTIENFGLYHRLEQWMKRWAPITLFVLALIPNPIFDVAGAVAGALKVPYWKFLIYIGAGMIIKYIAFASAGAWGIDFVQQFLT